MNSVLKNLKKRRPHHLKWLDDVPIHKHDCNECVYLGRFYNMRHAYDLYFHNPPEDKDNPNRMTFVARFGNDEKYISGYEFLGSNDALQVAFARKIIRDYI